MISVRANYPHMQAEAYCPLCTSGAGQVNERLNDSQEHLLICTSLNTGIELIENEIDYKDIFNPDPKKQAKITIVMQQRFQRRKVIESNLSK